MFSIRSTTMHSRCTWSRPSKATPFPGVSTLMFSDCTYPILSIDGKTLATLISFMVRLYNGFLHPWIAMHPLFWGAILPSWEVCSVPKARTKKKLRHNLIAFCAEWLRFVYFYICRISTLFFFESKFNAQPQATVTKKKKPLLEFHTSIIILFSSFLALVFHVS